MFSSVNLFVAAQLFLLISSVFSHPQCLDFRPPFELSQPLTFCTEYAAFGCCTQQRDAELEAQFQEILLNNQQIGFAPSACNNYTKTLLCQECSPYAAHVFDAEVDPSAARSTPGLCGTYCEQYYDTCISRQSCSNCDLPPTPSKQDFCDAQTISDMNYCYPELRTNSVLNGDIEREAITEDGCLCLEPFATNLRNPLAFRSPKDGSGRLFIAEQVGVVYAFHRNGSRVSSQPFLDISNRVLITNNAGDERGFLGIAFHPNFGSNGRLFVFYSLRIDGRHHTRVSEMRVASDNPDQVDYNSERVLFNLSQPFANHNGGEVRDTFINHFIRKTIVVTAQL